MLHGYLPWRDLYQIHGVLDDGLKAILGFEVFGFSRWAASAGISMFAPPAYWVAYFPSPPDCSLAVVDDLRDVRRHLERLLRGLGSALLVRGRSRSSVSSSSSVVRLGPGRSFSASCSSRRRSSCPSSPSRSWPSARARGLRPLDPGRFGVARFRTSRNTLYRDLVANRKVCPHCGHHMRATATERLDWTFDEDSLHPHRTAEGRRRSAAIPRHQALRRPAEGSARQDPSR